MCTPWTRRDLTKYFLSCRIPLVVDEEEAGTVCPSSSSQAPRVANAMNTAALHGNHSQQEKEPVFSSRHKSTLSSRVEEQEIDEDYIVLCFREDGAVHVVKDGKPEASSNHADGANKSSTRHRNRELVYGNSAEKVDTSCHGCMLLDEDEGDVNPSNKGDNVISTRKGKEKWRINLHTASPAVEHRGEDHIKEAEDSVMEFAESSDSNQSDSSSGSFAFPVLRWEGIGSPVQMPKPDALQLRKPKARDWQPRANAETRCPPIKEAQGQGCEASLL
ncbi:protein BREAKING OF ASYMMETRY IN THE STOMATAL LINEAGE [Diospyros lotus]|uniref:protein BREAKING OF ASYMMETRY IN THE STOMATAL LINEAGE n=1 Tax=Diospyros lotus TaxID=55363 RepID=UPI0022519CCD|nr:protein BREAKING OF ASYMMETRY IN THE STOMATAL LINEAGE [Diospyros lotus]